MLTRLMNVLLILMLLLILYSPQLSPGAVIREHQAFDAIIKLSF